MSWNPQKSSNNIRIGKKANFFMTLIKLNNKAFLICITSSLGFALGNNMFLPTNNWYCYLLLCFFKVYLEKITRSVVKEMVLAWYLTLIVFPAGKKIIFLTDSFHFLWGSKNFLSLYSVTSFHPGESGYMKDLLSFSPTETQVLWVYA